MFRCVKRRAERGTSCESNARRADVNVVVNTLILAVKCQELTMIASVMLCRMARSTYYSLAEHRSLALQDLREVNVVYILDRGTSRMKYRLYTGARIYV